MNWELRGQLCLQVLFWKFTPLLPPPQGEEERGGDGETLLFRIVYNRDGMEKKIEEYEKHKKNLERIKKDLQKQWESIQEERRRLE